MFSLCVLWRGGGEVGLSLSLTALRVGNGAACGAGEMFICLSCMACACLLFFSRDRLSVLGFQARIVRWDHDCSHVAVGISGPLYCLTRCVHMSR